VSVPEGAEVLEDGEALGRTPLHVTLDPGGEPRTFVLRLDGHDDLELVQDPAEGHVRVIAHLEPR
jgi:hypothetical protein